MTVTNTSSAVPRENVQQQILGSNVKMESGDNKVSPSVTQTVDTVAQDAFHKWSTDWEEIAVPPSSRKRKIKPKPTDKARQELENMMEDLSLRGKKVSKDGVIQKLAEIKKILSPEQKQTPPLSRAISTKGKEREANEYISEAVAKLEKDISILLKEIETTKQSIRANKQHDFEIIEKSCKQCQTQYDKALEEIQRLKKPVLRKIEDLREKIARGTYERLPEKVVQTIQTLHLQKPEDVYKREDDQDKIQSSRSTRCSTISTQWANIERDIDIAKTELDWLLEMTKCLKEKGSIPFKFWYRLSNVFQSKEVTQVQKTGPSQKGTSQESKDHSGVA